MFAFSIVTSEILIFVLALVISKPDAPFILMMDFCSGSPSAVSAATPTIFRVPEAVVPRLPAAAASPSDADGTL